MRYLKKSRQFAVIFPAAVFLTYITIEDSKELPERKFTHLKTATNSSHCSLLALSLPTALQSFETHMKTLRTRVPATSQRPRTCNNCNRFHYELIISSNSACAKPGHVDLLVLITTIPDAIKARDALRNTWLSHTKNNTGIVRHVFLFGWGWSKQEQAQLRKESINYGDIIQYDYKDAYYNLSYKVMSGFKWALKHCLKANFILRTADDNFVNIPKILLWIKRYGKSSMHAQIGFIHWRLEVWREITKKWYVSFAEFPEKCYPPYAIGTAFLYSMLAVKEVVNEAPNIPFFCLEDVWFGLVMREVKMPVIHEPLFFRELTQKYYRRQNKCMCPFNGNFLALHLVTPGAMPHLWNLCTSAR